MSSITVAPLTRSIHAPRPVDPETAIAQFNAATAKHAIRISDTEGTREAVSSPVKHESMDDTYGMPLTEQEAYSVIAYGHLPRTRQYAGLAPTPLLPQASAPKQAFSQQAEAEQAHQLTEKTPAPHQPDIKTVQSKYAEMMHVPKIVEIKYAYEETQIKHVKINLSKGNESISIGHLDRDAFLDADIMLKVATSKSGNPVLTLMGRIFSTGQSGNENPLTKSHASCAANFDLLQAENLKVTLVESDDGVPLAVVGDYELYHISFSYKFSSTHLTTCQMEPFECQGIASLDTLDTNTMTHQAREYFRFWRVLTEEAESGQWCMSFLCKDDVTRRIIAKLPNASIPTRQTIATLPNASIPTRPVPAYSESEITAILQKIAQLQSLKKRKSEDVMIMRKGPDATKTHIKEDNADKEEQSHRGKVFVKQENPHYAPTTFGEGTLGSEDGEENLIEWSDGLE